MGGRGGRDLDQPNSEVRRQADVLYLHQLKAQKLRRDIVAREGGRGLRWNWAEGLLFRFLPTRDRIDWNLAGWAGKTTPFSRKIILPFDLVF